MESESLVTVKFVPTAAQEVQTRMHRIQRREWWLWSYTALVLILLMVAIGSFAFPALLSQSGESYSFSMAQAVRALAGLILLFIVYVVYQQVQISRIRREVTAQIFAVDKVEILAEEVYKVAVLDSVTGLYNRRYVEQRLLDEIARSLRHSCPLTVVLLDLNNFKEVNDVHGHNMGDQVLKRFAEQLSKATRGSDLAARYGGDEFLVLLPECKIDEVQYVLKRLEGLKIGIGDQTLPISYAAGWAEFAPGESNDDLLKRADLALYANKRLAKGLSRSPDPSLASA